MIRIEPGAVSVSGSFHMRPWHLGAMGVPSRTGLGSNGFESLSRQRAPPFPETFPEGSSDMQAKTKASGSKVKAPSAAKAEGTWATTIKNALKKKQGNQGPAEANAKAHAQQSFAHSKMGRANPPR